MNYSHTTITPPLAFTDSFDIGLGGKGDSFFINLIPYKPTGVNLEPNKGVPLTPKPNVHLLGDGEGFGSVVTEGETLELTIGLSKVSDIDITVDYTVTNVSTGLDNKLFTNNNVTGIKDQVDYLSTSLQDSLASDFVSLAGQVVVPAGSLTATLSIDTVDDGVLSGYNIYRGGVVTITAQDNVGYMLHSANNSLPVLLKDANAYPVWTGEVEVYFKSHDLCSFEPLINPNTSSIQVITLGFEKDETDALTEITLAHLVAVDDLPAVELKLVPKPLTVEDIETDIPTDLSLMLPYYQCVLQFGRRS